MTKLIMTSVLLAFSCWANAEQQQVRVSVPEDLASITLPNDWRVAAEDERISPERPPDKAVSLECVTKNGTRVLVTVFKKNGFQEGANTPLDVFAKSLAKGFLKGSDAIDIRNGGKSKLGGLEALNLHFVHSKGETLLETYLAVAQDDQHYYAVMGVYRVRSYQEHSAAIAQIIKSFQPGKQDGAKALQKTKNNLLFAEHDQCNLFDNSSPTDSRMVGL